jgi:Tol biopolymer transport system component
MGEVYRARDTRLGRDVAIKILPNQMSADAVRKQRFEREAKTISALNHPNICVLHDVGSQDNVDYLVMECVEGETLAKRLEKGPLPLRQVLNYGAQIADALDRAHRAGIVHRDLKPGNIMLTFSGPKLMDFGLAKFAKLPVPDSWVLSELPTETERLTDEGAFIGTLHYMAPEQVEGKQADARTDIFALGGVIYEMATGRPAFTGRSKASLVAAILSSEPPAITSLNPGSPPALDQLVNVCLKKDPDSRWQSAHDLKLQLLWIESGEEERKAQRVGPATSWLRLGAAALLGAILSAALFRWSAVHEAVHWGPPVRFAIMLKPDESIDENANAVVALSPDGRLLAYAASRGDERGLYVRSLDSLEPKWLVGTDQATSPFFSPDGHWLGFQAGGALKKISLDGGAPQLIAETPYFAGAAWAPDNTIIYTPVFTGGLWKTDADGGRPRRLTTPEVTKGEHAHLYPEVLPGGHAVLFTIWKGGPADECEIAVLSTETGEKHVLFQGGYHARYVSTGHILYERSGNLMQIPFDLKRLRVSGRGTIAVEGVLSDASEIVASFAISHNGTLAYVPGTAHVPSRSLLWVDPPAKTEQLNDARRPYGSPRISPDQKLLALWMEEMTPNVWVYGLERGTLTKVTYGSDNHSVTWSPDGKRFAFESGRSGVHHIYVQSADGTGTEEEITTGEYDQYVGDWSPDGRNILFTEFHPDTGADLWVVSTDRDHRVRPFLQTPFEEKEPVFSPDGRWVAYVSNSSGQNEVYVQEFARNSQRMQISSDGGEEPSWGRSGRELFYRKGGKMMAVQVSTSPEFRVGKPAPLFGGLYSYSLMPNRDYDVGKDGRFIMVKPDSTANSRQINVVFGWSEDLKGRVTAQ